jgi:general secretion pathway protein C
MQAFLRKNFWVVNALTVVICSTLAARAANHLIEAAFLGDNPEPARPIVRPTVTKKPVVARSKTADPLIKRNIFCSDCEPPEPEVATGPISDSDTPPLTALPLRLVATTVTRPHDGSFATIAHTHSRRVGAYRIGDEIPEAGEVVRITGKYVDFKNGSARRVERLSHSERADPPPRSVSMPSRVTAPAAPRDELTAALDEGVNKVSEDKYEVDRSLVEKIMSNPAAIRGARIVPSIKDGKPNGFKLYAIRPSSAFAKIGLQNGDTIHSINGFELNSPDQALKVYTKLREATNLSVSLTRRGKSVTMGYTIR